MSAYGPSRPRCSTVFRSVIEGLAAAPDLRSARQFLTQWRHGALARPALHVILPGRK